MKNVIITLSNLLIYTSIFAQVAPAPNSPGAGNCLEFNAASKDYVAFTDIDPLVNFSVEAWIKPTGNNLQRILDKDGGGGQDYWLIYLATNGRIVVNLRDDNGPTMILNGNKIVSDGAWHHIAYVRNGTNSMLYVDGILDGIASYTAFSFQNTAPFTLATASFSPINGFNQNYSGQIDEVRFWNTTRTQTQIRDKMCQTLNPAIEPSLVGYWQMDAMGSTCGGATQVCDMTGNGNNGTLN